jgi:hypothetical protein
VTFILVGVYVRQSLVTPLKRACVYFGWPQTLSGREALMALYAGDGKSIVLHSAQTLVIHQAQDSRVVIIEHEAPSELSRSAMTARTQASTGVSKSK